LVNQLCYIFIILFVSNFKILFGQNQYYKSWKFVKEIIEQNKYCDYNSKEIIDSTLIDIESKRVLLVYCKDTLEKINGNVYICRKNGYYFYGNYMNGKKDGIWTLYKCNRKNKIVRKYLYKKDTLQSIITKPRKKPKRLNYIPSVTDMM
jgi:hypothetical protein